MGGTMILILSGATRQIRDCRLVFFVNINSSTFKSRSTSPWQRTFLGLMVWRSSRDILILLSEEMVLTSLNLAYWGISSHNTIHVTDADWTPFANLFRFKGCDEEALQRHKRKTLKALKNW